MPTGQMNRVLLHLRRVVEPHDDTTTDSQLLERFLRTRDEAAFELLVRRHGPMVLGVCRRIAGNLHDAEDAFQATFLVLARRAAAVSPRELLPGWLYGVAWRTARKARTASSRRRSREQPMKDTLQPAALPAEPTDDLQALLDAELAGLPDHQRSAVVLCDVQGRTLRDAARQLGIPVSTLSNRLGAARRTLARRLGRRGIALSAAAIGATLGRQGALANIPPALLASTVDAAACSAAGIVNAGAVSPAVEALTEGVLKMMMLGKPKNLTAMVLSLLVLVVGFGAATLPTLRGSPDEEAAPPKPKETQTRTAAEMALHWWASNSAQVNDETFFRRSSLDIRGVVPTALEMHFFLADRSPKKREKLIELLVGETNGDLPIKRWFEQINTSASWAKTHSPALESLQCIRCHDAGTRRSADTKLSDWINAKPVGPAVHFNERNFELPAKTRTALKPKDRFDRLLDELMAAKRPDAQVLDALTLATLGRLPTAGEERFMLDHVSRQRDRREAFENVVFVLVHSKETADQIETLKARRTAKAAAEVEWKGEWYAAEVLRTEGGRYFIRYAGYDDTWNEWVEKERIRFPKK